MASFFWPLPFVPYKVLFSDASSIGSGAFNEGSDLVCQKDWSTEESQKSSTLVYLEGARSPFAVDSAMYDIQ